jgi:hypothetical protein
VPDDSVRARSQQQGVGGLQTFITIRVIIIKMVVCGQSNLDKREERRTSQRTKDRARDRTANQTKLSSTYCAWWCNIDLAYIE